jgi:TonB family protein
MLHALIFIAAASCTMRDSVNDADARLSTADAALAQNNDNAAKTEYNAAFGELQEVPFFPDDKACDPGYPLARFTATLHSLVVAEHAGIMSQFEAYLHLRQMQKALFPALPHNAGSFFQKNYSDLSKRESTYIETIESAAQKQIIAAHNPQNGQCEWPDVDADLRQPVQPAYPYAARGVTGVTQAALTVYLDAAGHVTSVRVAHSTGNLALDWAALTAARQSTYLPAVKKCTRVPGSFDFTVTFDPRP